jgi:hypothetical protein
MSFSPHPIKTKKLFIDLVMIRSLFLDQAMSAGVQ